MGEGSPDSVDSRGRDEPGSRDIKNQHQRLMQVWSRWMKSAVACLHPQRWK